MISERLKGVILRCLKLDDFDIRDETIAPQVPGWDSLAHMMILAEIETEYGIRFRAADVVGLPNMGALQALVDKKVQAKHPA